MEIKTFEISSLIKIKFLKEILIGVYAFSCDMLHNKRRTCIMINVETFTKAIREYLKYMTQENHNSFNIIYRYAVSFPFPTKIEKQTLILNNIESVSLYI